MLSIVFVQGALFSLKTWSAALHFILPWRDKTKRSEVSLTRGGAYEVKAWPFGVTPPPANFMEVTDKKKKQKNSPTTSTTHTHTVHSKVSIIILLSTTQT